MPTYYVSDYNGERNEDAVPDEVLNPVSDGGAVETKVVEAPEPTPVDPGSAQAETA